MLYAHRHHRRDGAGDNYNPSLYGVELKRVGGKMCDKKGRRENVLQITTLP